MTMKTWNIERIHLASDLHGEIGSMDRRGSRDEPWLWRVMLGRYVMDFGRAKSRDDAVNDLLDVWEDLDERLEIPPPDHPGWDRLLDEVSQ